MLFHNVSGNITDIYKRYTTRNFTGTTFTTSTTQTYRTHYTYDYLNQLIREDDEEAGFSYTYSYDSSGNRVSKKKYAYTLGTLGDFLEDFNYSYASSSTGWGDKLIYDESTYDEISYDNIGNPIRISNAENSDYYIILSWNGRQLLSINEYSPDEDNTYTYTYNSDGIRISKTNGAIRWEYDLDGTTIIRARYYNYNTLQKIILFAYDNNGLPHAMKVTDASSGSGKWYYYEKNLQGDIVGIMNADGYKVVSYSYDAWGVPYAPVFSTDSVISAADKANAELNPFRYRGYYYDSETGYYYLQTRYYNPEWGRFINADSALYSNMLGFNMFVYCYNNPVNCIDPTGENGFSEALAGWASSAWGLTLVDGPLPIGDIVYWGGCAILGIFAVAETIALADTITNIVQEEVNQPSDLPDEKEIEVDIDHIMENHHPGNGKHPKKDKFPKWMTAPIIEEIVRYAYTDARNNIPNSIMRVQPVIEKGVEVIKLYMFGIANGQKINIWYNVTEKIIETAFPK